MTTTPPEPRETRVVALHMRSLRLAPIIGLLLAGLVLIYIGSHMAYIAAFVMGAGGGSAGLAAMLEIFRPVSRALLAFLLCGSLVAAVTALLCRGQRWLLATFLAGLIGGSIATFVPVLEGTLVDFTCAAFERMDKPFCL